MLISQLKYRKVDNRKDFYLKSATYRVSWEFTCKTTKILLLSIAFAVIDPFALYIMSGILWMQMLVLVSHTLFVLVLLLHVVALYKLILIYDDPHLFYKHLIKKKGNFVLELIDLAKYAAKREDLSLYNACIQRVYEILLKDDDEKE